MSEHDVMTIQIPWPKFMVGERVYIAELWGRPINAWGVITFREARVSIIPEQRESVAHTWNYLVKLDSGGQEQVVEQGGPVEVVLPEVVGVAPFEGCAAAGEGAATVALLERLALLGCGVSDEIGDAGDLGTLGAHQETFERRGGLFLAHVGGDGHTVVVVPDADSPRRDCRILSVGDFHGQDQHGMGA